jgi:tRNA A37 N6-isopentenylltransferase MiaA
MIWIALNRFQFTSGKPYSRMGAKTHHIIMRVITFPQSVSAVAFQKLAKSIKINTTNIFFQT